MSGETLYALYEEGHRQNNCTVDSWDELSDGDRDVWNWMAAQL